MGRRTKTNFSTSFDRLGCILRDQVNWFYVASVFWPSKVKRGLFVQKVSHKGISAPFNFRFLKILKSHTSLSLKIMVLNI
jgi:hypothetical protein